MKNWLKKLTLPKLTTETMVLLVFGVYIQFIGLFIMVGSPQTLMRGSLMVLTGGAIALVPVGYEVWRSGLKGSSPSSTSQKSLFAQACARYGES